MTRASVLLAVLVLVLTGCASPLADVRASFDQSPRVKPRLEAGRIVTFDGQKLGLTTWKAEGGEPWAVIVAVHGMNDYANAFHLAGAAWAKRGITTYAYDMRGFGRSPNRGKWGGQEAMAEDLRTVVALVRKQHPEAQVAVVGESTGAAVAIAAFSSSRPPNAHKLILVSPAVWGWSKQPLLNRVALYVAAKVLGDHTLEPPSFVTSTRRASDNIEELRAMGRDPLMIWGASPKALYGLVGLMETAYRDVGRLRVPTAYLAGANDQIIPIPPLQEAAAALAPGHRTAWYENGWHLLLRDHHREAVFADVESFLRDSSAPWPSGAPDVPAPESATWLARASAESSARP